MYRKYRAGIIEMYVTNPSNFSLEEVQCGTIYDSMFCVSYIYIYTYIAGLLQARSVREWARVLRDFLPRALLHIPVFTHKPEPCFHLLAYVLVPFPGSFPLVLV